MSNKFKILHALSNTDDIFKIVFKIDDEYTSKIKQLRNDVSCS